MAEMMTKKHVSNLMFLVVTMVLMINQFINCEITNIGDIGSDDHYHDHDDDNNATESHDLIPHHHHNDGRGRSVSGRLVFVIPELPSWVFLPSTLYKYWVLLGKL
ncbi:hypothetical protein FNV43_RR08622 [Rhamnella rubrinervis]|uniref:Transmembrane protein n=1 Tax=Rhamnella rubrinervis TaxID=2594499 RepID=A0A8K0H9L1_9ROSA|nr:hypothetical protein FNV43_RR08622 [Rhamnella rubrinervis]